MACNVCGAKVEHWQWLCGDCKAERDSKQLEEHLAKDLCQECGHHKFDHQGYEKDGRCVACTCSKFKPVFGRVT